MKKLAFCFFISIFTFGFTFAQKSNNKKSEKFYTKNWKVVKTDNSSKWEKTKPKKNLSTNSSLYSTKPKSINTSRSLSSKSKKQKGFRYPSSASNASKKDIIPVKLNAPVVKKSTVNKSVRVSSQKPKLFSNKKKN